MALIDDVWELPPLEVAPDDLAELAELERELHHGTSAGRPHYWRTAPVADRWHDCSVCRSIIGPGDPYYREAVPMHTRVLVTKLCCQCGEPW